MKPVNIKNVIQICSRSCRLKNSRDASRLTNRDTSPDSENKIAENVHNAPHKGDIGRFHEDSMPRMEALNKPPVIKMKRQAYFKSSRALTHGSILFFMSSRQTASISHDKAVTVSLQMKNIFSIFIIICTRFLSVMNASRRSQYLGSRDACFTVYSDALKL